MPRSDNSPMRRIEVLLPPEVAAAIEADATARGERLSEYLARAGAKRAKVQYQTQKPGRKKAK